MSLDEPILSRRGLGRLGVAAATLAAVGAVKACNHAGASAGHRRHHQGRHPAFAVRHHGDQRDHAEGRHADADRAAEQERRPAGQEAGGRGGRSGLQLAAVRRKGPSVALGRQVRRGVRLLDLGLAQVRAAGVRGTERHPVLSGAVRRPGVQPQRVLHRRGAESAGDPGGRLPDEGKQGEALGAGRHRLRLSAHHEPDPGSLPEVEGCGRRTTS